MTDTDSNNTEGTGSDGATPDDASTSAEPTFSESKTGLQHRGEHEGLVREPPRAFFSVLRSVGPGLIVAGSIVGSGELIATTKTGAEAGFSFLWLILLGCVVKVFAQIELGRYTMISGKTTLTALAEVPGPRIKGRGNWLVWYWMVMWLASISQQGGIVGGVGQALSISFPITSQGQAYNEIADVEQLLAFEQFSGQAEGGQLPNSVSDADGVADRREVARLWDAYREEYGSDPGHPELVAQPMDTNLWGFGIACVTSAILFFGRYGFIQTFSTVLVGSFTLLTVLNLVLLQGEVDYRVSLAEFWEGLKLGFPENETEGGSA
ncbi:MAG: Nramp family divalent metal transporter, partial [Planctomycetota bacterium]